MAYITNARKKTDAKIKQKTFRCCARIAVLRSRFSNLNPNPKINQSISQQQHHTKQQQSISQSIKQATLKQTPTNKILKAANAVGCEAIILLFAVAPPSINQSINQSINASITHQQDSLPHTHRHTQKHCTPGSLSLSLFACLPVSFSSPPSVSLQTYLSVSVSVCVVFRA